MTDIPISLDRHRSQFAQRATEMRRSLAEVRADTISLREHHDALEAQLAAAPAASWPEAAGKARYLLGLLAATPVAKDARRQRLIQNVLADFARLTSSPK